MAVSRWRSNTGSRRPTPATACATQSPRPLLRSCHGGGLRCSQGADRLRQHRQIQLKAVGKRVLQRFAVSFDRAARMGRSRFKAVGQAYGPSFNGMLERSGARSAPEDQDCSGSRRSRCERHAYRCAVRQQHRMVLHRCQQIVEQAIRCTVCATRRSGAENHPREIAKDRWRNRAAKHSARQRAQGTLMPSRRLHCSGRQRGFQLAPCAWSVTISALCSACD